MPLTRLKRKGHQKLYLPQQHHTAAAQAKAAAIETAAENSTIPDEWQDFEAFALACKTRQRGGIRGLELYPWQRSLMNLLDAHGSVVICKSRQVGGSQALLLRALWRAILEPGFMGLVASKSFADAQLLARRMRRALQGLPGIEPVNDSLSHLVLPNDSQILFRSSSPADGLSRGVDALSFCLCDEYSFWDNGAEALGSLGPAMAQTESPELIIVSTPNGKTDDYWAKLTQSTGPADFEAKLERIRNQVDSPYQEIEPGEGMAVAICHWRAIPNYADEPDFLGRMQRQFGLGESDIKREFELNFEESAQNVFNFTLVRNGIQETLENACKDAQYFCGIDPAGPGSDYTVAIMLRLENNVYSVAGMYRKRAGTSQQHISKITDLIEEYEPIKTVVETNSIGSVYFENISSTCTMSDVEGFYTSQQKKETLIGRVILALEKEELKYPEGPISNELLGFQRVGKRLEAGHGHDDTVMALGLALEAANYGKPETSRFGFITVDMEDY